MKHERLILSGMVFILIWTTILCQYHIKITEMRTNEEEKIIPPTEIVTQIEEQEPATPKKKSRW